VLPGEGIAEAADCYEIRRGGVERGALRVSAPLDLAGLLAGPSAVDSVDPWEGAPPNRELDDEL
jgi:hypothetical protein